MELHEKLLKRIESSEPIYDNVKFAKDLEIIANNHYEQRTTHSVITSTSFLEDLKEAIKYGEGEDWGYDGEEEFKYETFDADESFKEVIKALKRHLL